MRHCLCYCSRSKRFCSVVNSVADPDPNPDPDESDPYVLGPPLIRDMDRDPDPSIIRKHSKKNLDFVTSLRLFIFKNDVNPTSKSNKQKNFCCCHL